MDQARRGTLSRFMSLPRSAALQALYPPDQWLPLSRPGDDALMGDVAAVIFRPMAERYLPDAYRTLMVGLRQVPLSKRPACLREASSTAKCGRRVKPWPPP